MALFSLNISHVSRRTGAHIVRYAAYRAGERLKDHTTGRTHDYTSKSDVIHKEILAPKDAPDWVRDREKLWNVAERSERRRDSRLAQEVYVAIPREVPADRRLQVVRDFAQETFVARGMVADFAIHSPLGTDGKENPHAHILLTTRGIEGDGFGLKQTAWSHPMRCREYRASWELHANTAFAKAGMLERIDRRSLAVQRREVELKLERAIATGQRSVAFRLADRAAALDRLPEPSHSRATSHMEKKGIRTRRGDQIREVRRRNSLSLEERRRRRRREVEIAFRNQRIERIRDRVHQLPRQLVMDQGLDLSPWQRDEAKTPDADFGSIDEQEEIRRREMEEKQILHQQEPLHTSLAFSNKRDLGTSLDREGELYTREESERAGDSARREGKYDRDRRQERTDAERAPKEIDIATETQANLDRARAPQAKAPEIDFAAEKQAIFDRARARQAHAGEIDFAAEKQAILDRARARQTGAADREKEQEYEAAVRGAGKVPSADRTQAMIDGTWRSRRERKQERDRGDEGLGLG